jgi:hypothetical protein
LLKSVSVPDTVRLKIAVAEHPHTSAIRNGVIPIEGVDAEIVTVEPQMAAFRRMVRQVEFDVCEIAPATYIIARAYGAPFVALPIFVLRRFHHSGLLVRPDAGIRTPKDLEGQKVGVRAYSVTTGVWTRGILIDQYGLDSSKVTGVVDDVDMMARTASSRLDFTKTLAWDGPAIRRRDGWRRIIRSCFPTRRSWRPIGIAARGFTPCTGPSW